MNENKQKQPERQDLSNAVSAANIESYESLDYVSDYEHDSLDIFDSENQKRIEGIIKQISLKNNSRFLDVGCGTGNILKYASKYFIETYGVDYSAKALRLAKQYTSNLVKGDGRMLPFKSDTFDGISFYSVLHHLYDPQELFDDAYRVIKPGGFGYTDHDPNLFFFSIMRPILKLYNLLTKGRFEQYKTGSLTEYHHIPGNELNPLLIKSQLIKSGFINVEIHYRPYNANKFKLSRLINLLFRFMSVVFPKRFSCYYFYLFFEKR